MAKTLRSRIAAVAVAALGAGVLVATPASAASTSLSASGVGRVGGTLKISVVSDDTSSSEIIHIVPLSGGVPTGGAIPVDPKPAMSGGKVTVTYTDNGSTTKLVAGTYRFVLWANTTNSAQTTPGASDVSTTVSVTLGGVPAVAAFSTAPTSAPAAAVANAKFVATLKDASGVATLLTTGETLSASATAPNGTVNIAATATTGTSPLTLTQAADGTFTFYVGNSSATVTTVKVAGAGLLTSLVPAASATLTTVSYEVSTDFSVKSPSKGVLKSDYTDATALTGTSDVTQALVASTAVKTITFQVKTAAAGKIIATVAKNSTATLPAGVTAGDVTVTTTNTGTTAAPVYTGTFSVTSTGAVAATSYKVSVPVSDTAFANYTVTFEAPTVTSATNMGTISSFPAAGDSPKAVIGGTNTITYTIKDQFGIAFPGANVFFSVAGANTVASTSKVSDASGKASFSWTDTKAKAGNTDVASVTAGAATQSTVRAGSDVTFTYVAAAQFIPSTVTVSLASTTAAIDASVVATATAKDIDGTVLAGIPVTFTVDSHLYAVSTVATVFTNNSGQATFTVAGYKTGTATVTATSGGVAGTKTYKVTNVAADARAIKLSAANVTVSNTATRLTATVTDRYGNPVAGHSVTVSYVGTAGRITAINGTLSGAATTATDGTVVIDIEGANSEAGTGTLKVSLNSAAYDAAEDTETAQGAAYPAVADSASTAVIVKADASITSIQTALAALVASLTATLTALTAQINKIMKKLRIK